MIKYGLIGIGGFGSYHLKVIRDLELAKKVSLVAVCDPTIHGLPDLHQELLSRNVRIYEDLDDMLEKEQDLTAVSIATPIPLHYQMAMACLERNLFVYLEKPVVPLLDQLEELIEADQEKRIAVGFQIVEADWSRKIKQWVLDGLLGDLREIRVAACWPRGDRYYNRAKWAGLMHFKGMPVFDGPATNALAHLVHNVMYFSADSADAFDVPVEIQGEMYRARPIQSYDTVCLRGRSASGVQFHLALTHAAQHSFPFAMHVIGTKGWATVSEDGRILDSSHTSRSIDLRSDVLRTEDLVTRNYGKFINYINGSVERPATLLQDTRGYAIATNALLQSSGGIHSIGSPWVCREEKGGVHCVQQFPSAVEETLHCPLLFSERRLPWAVESSVVETDNFAGIDDSLVQRYFENAGEKNFASFPASPEHG